MYSGNNTSAILDTRTGAEKQGLPNMIQLQLWYFARYVLSVRM